MKFYLIVLLSGIYSLLGSPCQAWAQNLIPFPQKITQEKEDVLFVSRTAWVCDNSLASVESFYKELLQARLRFDFVGADEADSRLVLNMDEKLNLPEEGYRLHVVDQRIEISASTEKGLFYGLQTLLQLAKWDGHKKAVKISRVDIEDAPRFGWRGLMLDVSRTFMPVPLVKRYIDLMAAYKLNVLHFHLTDDQGWRIEIKKYPRLTTVGSRFAPEFNEMGGYYTQKDIRDLVAYAALRNVTIVPEIEFPGHSCAALAAYPNLSCRGISPKIHPYTKGPGIHSEILCAGKPEVYEFIYGVLDEVLELFPSEYIHIGGDEAPKSEWKKCPHCQQTIKDNHLANEEELQSLLVTKIGAYLTSKNRKLIGWDEIMAGGKLKGDEVIMYWRSWAGKQVTDHAKAGFKIIASPNTHCYFDYTHEQIDTKKVYLFEPIPVEIPADKRTNYIGVQANFWSHLDRSENRIDRQLFPRLFALAEVAWTNPGQKDWKRFKEAAKTHNERLRWEQDVNGYYDDVLYYPEYPD